jgi:hypothetical protein
MIRYEIRPSGTSRDEKNVKFKGEIKTDKLNIASFECKKMLVEKREKNEIDKNAKFRVTFYDDAEVIDEWHMNGEKNQDFQRKLTMGLDAASEVVKKSRPNFGKENKAHYTAEDRNKIHQKFIEAFKSCKDQTEIVSYLEMAGVRRPNGTSPSLFFVRNQISRYKKLKEAWRSSAAGKTSKKGRKKKEKVDSNSIDTKDLKEMMLK